MNSLNCISNGMQNNTENVLNQIGSSKYNLKDAVKLPVDEIEPREWIAINIFDFHKQVCMLYGTIVEFCTAETCPRMTAGKKYEFLWSDGPANEPVALSASEYIHHLLDWVQEQLDDERVFPTKDKRDFPDDYMEICASISKRLFRVFAHVFHHHSSEVRGLKEEAHMNTSLKHFIYFVQTFNLVQPSDLEPLKDYIQNLA